MNDHFRPREQAGRQVERNVLGHQVTLQFPEKPDADVSRRVREALIDSFIQKYAVKSQGN